MCSIVCGRTPELRETEGSAFLNVDGFGTQMKSYCDNSQREFETYSRFIEWMYQWLILVRYHVTFGIFDVWGIFEDHTFSGMNTSSRCLH